MDKKANLLEVLKAVDKKYGKGTIKTLDDSKTLNIPVISTGILPLDIALGVGGYPKGRIIEIFGNESSGKTTIALHAIAQVQKNNGTAVFIDAEHALDPSYAKAIGVNLSDLIICQPDFAEQALDIVEDLITSNAVDLIIIDSVAALAPRAEIDGDIGDAQVGLQARLMSKAMRKLTAIANKTNTVVIFLNQIREKVGIMFGNPETTTGGRALKFYSTIRLDVRKGEAIKHSANLIGSKVKVKVAKSKVSPPFKVAEFDILYGIGVSNSSAVLDMAVDLDIVDKSGAYFSYQGTRLGQGKDNARKFLDNNPALVNEIEDKIRSYYRKNMDEFEDTADNPVESEDFTDNDEIDNIDDNE